MQIRQARFMYSAPTDHESALDLWQCLCIIVKMVGWGGEDGEEEEVEEEEVSGFILRPFGGF